MEQNPRNGSVAKKGTSRLLGRYDVEIISYVSKLRDPDGTSAKYAIDAMVSAKILEDDSPQYIREIKHRQCKVQKGNEKTEIILSRVDEEMEEVLEVADDLGI
jgi:hypothetical protein